MNSLALKELKESKPASYLDSIGSFKTPLGSEPRALEVSDRIVIAEDQRVNFDAIKLTMHEIGLFRYCNFCKNGQAAIDTCKRLIKQALAKDARGFQVRPIRALLLDYEMPLKTGIQVVTEVRDYI